MKEDKLKKEEKVEKTSDKKISKLEDELAKANHDMEYWKNEYYKAYADMANLRKDIEKDHREAIKYRLEGFVSDLLPILDSFDIAFRVEPSNEELKNYLKGFQFVYKSLLQVLENEGITMLSPKVGDKFDESFMNAVDTVEDEGEENIVKDITLKGYKLHDHLVRAAMVKVSKHPSEKKDEIKEEEKEN